MEELQADFETPLQAFAANTVELVMENNTRQSTRKKRCIE
jgi:hypothetical protein